MDSPGRRAFFLTEREKWNWGREGEEKEWREGKLCLGCNIGKKKKSFF